MTWVETAGRDGDKSLCFDCWSSERRKNRKEIIQRIEQKRGSKVITYITNDRIGLPVKIAGDSVSIIHDHILAFKEEERKRLDLFIYSRGGHPNMASITIYNNCLLMIKEIQASFFE